jgi:hypothetical protein
MSTIRCIYEQEPAFPPTDQHPDAVRFKVGDWWVDAIGGEPTLAEVEAIARPSQRPAAVEEFKAKRETTVSRLVQLAFVARDEGNDAFANAQLALRKKVIPLDAHPLVVAAPDHDITALRAAFVAAYRAETAAALATAPDPTTAAAWKVEIDKVFK